MPKRHIRDISRELADSELHTELRPREILPARQRQYYDLSDFPDETDSEFLSVEPPPAAFSNSQYITDSQANNFDRYSRGSGMGYTDIEATQPGMQTQSNLPYQPSFFQSAGRQSQTIASPPSRQQYIAPELMRPPSRLTLGPRPTPPMLLAPQMDPISYNRDLGTGAAPPASQSGSFLDRFKYHSPIAEPATPLRTMQKPPQARSSSSSDDFDLGSSPSAMPPPSRRGQPVRGIYKSPVHASSQFIPHSPTLRTQPRENPLNALIKKPTQPKKPQSRTVDEGGTQSTQSQYEQNHPPRQALTLSHAPTMVQGIQLVQISALPAKYHPIFPYKIFNATQSKCFDPAYNTNNNIVLSSPTGSGKTAVMELAICRLMQNFEPGTFKIIYQAPTKALCAERKRDWEKKFTPLGLKCTELTGDTQFNQLSEVKNGDLIVTTPEKWDSVTRRWADHKKLLGLVRLFLIDEVHILKEDRGATLEVVVSRMKTIGSRVRFVALSATVPNSKDIATWLGKDCDNSNLPAHEERLGEEFRPVKLEKIVYGYQANSNDFVFDKFLDQKLYEVIQKHSQRKPVMIFCATRNICVSTAKILAEKWNGAGGREKAWPTPLVNFSLRDKDLQCKLTGKSGVAFHHAGLEVTDRNLIEKLFLEGHISVICCTSTLAVGVNLPTHLVVIKNTVSWQGCQMREYLDLEVMQMVGRAGRPQFDTTGVAVIMTRREKKDKYERMISGTEKLESCLHLNLIEHLNAEIGLGTITDIESAKQWLRSTFLYIRMKSNPAYYKLKVENIEAELESIMERDIAALEEAGFIEWQETKLRCLETGDAMARYYIKFGTMKSIMNLKGKAKTSEILTCLSEAEEFKEFRIRSGEKGVLKEINSSPSMKWPVKVDINSPAHKVNILIQFEIGCMEFPTTEGFQKYRATLLQDKSLIFQHLHRLVRCICDVKLFLRDAIGCRNALELSRCIEAKVWENSPSMLLQLEGLGLVGMRKFVNNDIKSIDQLDALEAHKIEMIASRNPPYGAKIKQDIAGIPRFRLYTQITRVQANRKDPVKVNFRAEIGVLNDQTPARWHGKLLHFYFLAERSDGYLVDFRRMPILKLASNKDVTVQAEVSEPGQTITCYVACEEIVNTSKSVEVELDIKESQFPPTKKEGTISAFLQKRANMDPLRQELIDITGSQTKIVNKPFKMPTQEASKVSAEEVDDFEDEEFEKELMELDHIGEEKIKQPTPVQRPLRDNQGQAKIVQSVVWTPINNKDSQQLSINNGSEDDLQPLQEEESEESIEPKQRPDGKWDCNHHCADKTICRHFCCREGLDKKPKLKKKVAPKAGNTTKHPGSAHSALAAKRTDLANKANCSQKQLSKELPQTKSTHSIHRKRVSDLVSAATTSTVTTFIDLSKDDDSPSSSFKGNGADSLRKLNELHSKCQANKSIKLPKHPKPIYPLSLPEKSEVVPKRQKVSDELEQLLTDDEDFPTLSELMEEAWMKNDSSKRNKEKGVVGAEEDEEELYGLKDDLLDSLDVYVLDTLNNDPKTAAGKADNLSIFDFPENTPPKADTKNNKRKLTTLRGAGVGEGGSIRKEKTGAGSKDNPPSSPPLIADRRDNEGSMPPTPSKPTKKVRFNDEALQDISTKPLGKQSPNPIFITTSESNMESGDDKGSSGGKIGTPDTSIVVSPRREINGEKENELDQELMDFLGDCVVFV
ncbi:Sec63 [Orbilia blumenaviensis]|uniref:DNA 3'-5' helicase n=1 Tax=Orbilia blumenaviensis TaxID=1796055 RepID=A0AAV9VLS7_9PEZI